MANTSDPKSTHSYIYNMNNNNPTDVTDLYKNQEADITKGRYQSAVLLDDDVTFFSNERWGVSNTSLRAYIRHMEDI